MKRKWIASQSRLAKLLSAVIYWLALLSAAFALSACVTVNIYFPAAAAEQAADKIIEEVWQTKKNGTESSNKPAMPEAKRDGTAVKEEK